MIIYEFPKFTVFRSVRIVANIAYYLRHVHLSVLQYVLARPAVEVCMCQSDVLDITKTCREITNLIEAGREHWTLYMKNYVGFEVADDVKSP